MACKYTASGQALAHPKRMAILKRSEKRAGKFQNPVPTRVGGLSTILKVLPLYLTNKEEKVPRHPLGPFHTDAGAYAPLPEDGLRVTGLRVTWFGHSSMLLEIDGV